MKTILPRMAAVANPRAAPHPACIIAPEMILDPLDRYRDYLGGRPLFGRTAASRGTCEELRRPG